MQDPDWRRWQFFHKGDDFFDHLLFRIQSAQKSIHIETYIFEMDSITEKILDELGRARQRGVKIQLLVDGVGSYRWLEDIFRRALDLGLDIRVWQPVPKTWSGVRRFLWLTGFQGIRIFRHLNRRNHRKIAFFDQEIILLGSQNLTHVHSEKEMGSQAWRDSAIEVEGPETFTLLRSMHLAWRRSTPRGWRIPFQGLKDHRYDPENSLLRLHQDRRSRRILSQDFLQRIDQAQEKVFIASAYFLPTRRQFIALRNAARRGVLVAILIPEVSDVPLVKWAGYDLVRSLLKSGVHVFEFKNRVFHAKYNLIDHWACLGSANLNHRSFFHDLEIEVTLKNPKALRELENQWSLDCENSRALNPHELERPVFWRRWLYHLAFRLRYLL